MCCAPRRCLALVVGLVAVLLLPAAALAQQPGEEQVKGAAAGAIPKLSPPPELGALAGKRIVRIEVATAGGRWVRKVQLERVRVGEPLSYRAGPPCHARADRHRALRHCARRGAARR